MDIFKQLIEDKKKQGDQESVVNNKQSASNPENLEKLKSMGSRFEQILEASNKVKVDEAYVNPDSPQVLPTKFQKPVLQEFPEVNYQAEQPVYETNERERSALDILRERRGEVAPQQTQSSPATNLNEVRRIAEEVSRETLNETMIPIIERIVDTKQRQYKEKLVNELMDALDPYIKSVSKEEVKNVLREFAKKKRK